MRNEHVAMVDSDDKGLVEGERVSGGTKMMAMKNMGTFMRSPYLLITVERSLEISHGHRETFGEQLTVGILKVLLGFVPLGLR